MKLSKLKEIVDKSLLKYGDFDVLIDTEARQFKTHMVEIKDADTYISSEGYVCEPWFILYPSYKDTIMVKNKINKLEKEINEKRN